MEKKLQEMIKKAEEVRYHAYTPYSRFKVGVCLRTEDNQFFVGCNVENASYGLTICAEITAIGRMISSGAHRVAEIVVTPCSPCGACRQILREFAGPETLIHIASDQAELQTFTLMELLPHSFGPEHIK